MLFLRNLRFAARSLRRAPGFSLAAILTLAVAVGASTAVVSAAYTLLMRPLPLRDAGRLSQVSVSAQQGKIFMAPSRETYKSLARGGRTVESAAGWNTVTLALETGGVSRVTNTTLVSPEYFSVLGIPPAMGRWGTGADEITLSDPVWRTRFGADPAVVGRTVRLNGAPFRVAGVAPAALTAAWVGARPEIWAPLAAEAALLPSHGGVAGANLLVRLRPGVSANQAEAEILSLARASDRGAGSAFAIDGVMMQPLSPIPWERRDAVKGALQLLAIATALVLLAACVNVAGLLVARGAARAKEAAVRAALGAGRGRVAGEAVTETLLLTFCGGALGVLASAWIGAALTRLPWPDQIALEISPGAREWGFGLGLTVVLGLLLSVVPLLRAPSTDLALQLRGGDARGRGLAGSVVVIGQVALSVVLLAGAGLFMRALNQAWRVDPGFDPAGVVTAEIDLAPARLAGGGGELMHGLAERARSLPGVERAALSLGAPFTNSGGGMISVEVPGRESPAPIFAQFNAVQPDYFRLLRMRLLSGRVLTDADREGVAVVSASMARAYWPAEGALGRRVMLGGEALEVVGVVADVKDRSLAPGDAERLYLPLAQMPGMTPPVLSLKVRPGQETAVAAALAAELRRRAPAVPPPAFRSVHDAIGESLVPQRLGAMLVGSFGAAALLLACIGVYGAMAYAVTQRTREIGIRAALGARAADTRSLFLRRAGRLALTGVGVGTLAALGATRAVRHLLYGVSHADPFVFVAVAVLLGGATLLAAYVPARRATRVDPMVSLRTD
jgi:putative ABC transport system permease protein